MNDDKIYYGEVVFFSAVRGYGFLQWDIDGVQQDDMFIHYSNIIMDGYKTIAKGQRVSFSIGTNDRGEPKAINVIAIKY